MVSFNGNDAIEGQGQEMQTKNVNKNKYFWSHFESTFCSDFDWLMNADFQIIDL